ncbi:polysaccharide deacetylase family protein [bacterium]|nr:polysaccharide deacetylase family protein [bacterium]
MNTRLHCIAKLFYPLLDFSGFLDLYLFLRARIKPICWILVYHHISDDLGQMFTNVTPRLFEKQIRYPLARNFKVLSLAQLIEYIQRNSQLPSRSVVITFDDGYKNNYIYAYPILRKYKLPATIFLTTGLINGSIKPTSLSEIYREIFSKYPQEGLSLQWEEIREMSDNGIEFGAHTVSHPLLTRVSLDKAREEIELSKMEIEEKLGKEVKYFSYPYGDYNEEIIEIVKVVGFHCALTVEPFPIKKWTNLYKLGRIAIVSNFHHFKALASCFVSDIKRKKK